jgi:hypothetical protein
MYRCPNCDAECATAKLFDRHRAERPECENVARQVLTGSRLRSGDETALRRLLGLPATMEEPAPVLVLGGVREVAL